MNASSNASVGKLRKHPCGALGAGKQQRLAAGGSRGAHVARLASAGARARSMAKNTQTPKKRNPNLVALGFSSDRAWVHCRGRKAADPRIVGPFSAISCA